MKSLRFGDLFRLSFLVLWLASPAQAWFFGKDHPSQSEVESYVRSELSKVLAIEEIEIGSQDIRQELIEFSESRVRVTVSTTEPLYGYANQLPDGTPLIETRTAAGTSVVAFALVKARAIGEGWEGRVFWDDNRVFQNLGRPRAQMPRTALLKGSDAHSAHLALLAEQRAAAARQRLALQQAVSGDFEGRVVCGRQQHEVASLRIDAVAGTGRLVTRKVALVDQPWAEIDLKVEQTRQEDSFWVSGADWGFTVAPGTDGPVFSHRHCDIAFYPAGEIPQEVTAERDRQAEMLALLSVGKVEAEALFGAERRPHAEAEILEIGDRGFRMKLFHTSRLNGRFGGPNFAYRATSTLTVKFADPPARPMIGGQVEGRGELMLNPRCPIDIAKTDDGGLRLQEHEGYLCALRLDLIP
ncbi:hypothetical protein [Marinovum sp.]|uniref:hypothetical protein n=1 Tax=Marinovum sp. TaxID=2024839 RepID=UPI002B273B12|nr:hypothetical protein [Marinovum sp.]